VDAWSKLGEKVVYDRFRRVVSRSFSLPDGTSAEFEVLELSDSAAVLALTPAEEVVLVREFRPGPEAVLLELPGGVVEARQTPLEAARAELLEETGYAGDLVEVGTILKDAYATNTKHAFAATDCRRVAVPEYPLLTEPVLIPLAEFRAHLRTGRLTDADAAYRALDHLGLL
jgi:ADP-ribose pyrophosphatase